MIAIMDNLPLQSLSQLKIVEAKVMLIPSNPINCFRVLLIIEDTL
jgi:hypothetical protein